MDFTGFYGFIAEKLTGSSCLNLQENILLECPGVAFVPNPRPPCGI